MYKLYKGDCLVESNNIIPDSVDLVLTDLPYGTVKNIANSESINHGMGGKCEWDNVIDTDKIMQIANLVLRKNGKMILFAQQPFTNELINAAVANVPFNYSMIWEKDHFANALTAKKAPVNYYEDILIFSKNNTVHDFDLCHPLRQYFKKVLDFIGVSKAEILKTTGGKADHVLRVNSSQFSLCTLEVYEILKSKYDLELMPEFINYEDLTDVDSEFKKESIEVERAKNPSTFNLWEGGKFKSNILKYKKDYDGYHPTQKPVALLEDLIKTFSNEGDTVLDLTMGSGSTGVACMNTGRKFIGIEKDDGYFEIAKNRIDDAFNYNLY